MFSSGDRFVGQSIGEVAGALTVDAGAAAANWVTFHECSSDGLPTGPSRSSSSRPARGADVPGGVVGIQCGRASPRPRRTGDLGAPRVDP